MLYVVYILSILSIFGTLLPRNDSKHWFVRGQANFRAIYFVLNSILLFCMLFWVEVTVIGAIIILLLMFSILVSLKTIIPYTPLAKKQIADATDNSGNVLKLFIHNVYQFNTEYEKLLELIKEENPDVILLLETGVEWDRATQALEKDYPHVVKEIRENTYGIIMMTKLPVLEGGINHLVSEEIPSAEMLLELGDTQVRVLGIHPEPPLPGHAPTSIPKEKEILASANYLSTKLDLDHAILAGDLNDVAWSKVSKRFKKVTGMKDPREGRGFYSTFPTYFPIRIPLDNIFCSDSFRLKSFERLRNIGSDHYPLMVILQLPVGWKSS